MRPYRVAVAGYGWAATAHIEAIQATGAAEVVAVFSSRDLDPATLSQEHGGSIRVYNDFAEMVADPGIDVVDVTSYPSQHRDQAVAAAAAGKHLIIEKPLALSLGHCREILEAVGAAGVRACVCFECRHGSQFVTTKALIDSGMLGEVHYGEIDYYHGIGPWYGQYRWNTKTENGGSSLLSAGCHALDALLLCMGGEVEAVTSYATGSQSEVFSAYEYPTTSTTLLRFADGRVGKCASVIDCWQPYYFHTHLVGSGGSLLDDKFHSGRLGALKRDGWSRLNMSLMDSGDVSDHPYQTQFESFFAALARDEDMPLTSLAEAYGSFEVIFAADLSAEEGREVRLAELRG